MTKKQNEASLLGLCAVILWSLLALFTTFNNYIPAFQLLGFSFFIATLVGVGFMLATRQSFKILLRLKWQAWVLGIYGLFGFHLCYFLALRFAPPMEANIITALWPLLIVMGSVLVLKGSQHDTGLKWWHIIGAILGLAGVLNVSLANGLSGFIWQYLWGYGFALLCAFIWSSYSLLLRKLPDVPTAAVTGFCMVTSILAFGFHFAFETTIWPETGFSWVMLVAIGLGPVGASFYFWDYGMKHGDLRALGAASYLSPIFATMLLALAGYGILTYTVVVSSILVVGGALLASKDILFKPRKKR
ncbi:MAG: DMT family transporter [Rhizobiales bacterium]|nr:DMT family transporter [Hyphomicrobiales bacterium]NRB14702.1 DMT family transporter [Hyphomicrobiales bacterium]